MDTRIKTFSFTIVLDAAGDGSKTQKLINDVIVGSPTAFKSGAFESVEFFNLFIYTRTPSVLDPTAGGGGGGDAGGGGGGSPFARPLSPPSLGGSLFRSGDELVVKIEAGVDNALGTYRVLIPYQVVTD